MRATPPLVSAPLNPMPIAEHFRRSHPPCPAQSRTTHISEENNVKRRKQDKCVLKVTWATNFTVKLSRNLNKCVMS